jgi:hypothetical protein
MHRRAQTDWWEQPAQYVAAVAERRILHADAASASSSASSASSSSSSASAGAAGAGSGVSLEDLRKRLRTAIVEWRGAASQ